MFSSESFGAKRHDASREKYSILSTTQPIDFVNPNSEVLNCDSFLQSGQYQYKQFNF